MFDLARQMERLGHFARLYTGYPRFKVKDLPSTKVSTFPWFVGPYMALNRVGVGTALRKFDHMIHTSFDSWVCRHLERCDVYHSLSSVGLCTYRMAKERYGALTVCDRASTHIISQDRILQEEFETWGVPYPGIDERIIERELAEYELCDIIVLPSSFAIRSFVEQGVPPQKLRRNPFGVNLKLFRQVAKTDGVFRVLFVGQIGLRKGVLYLLEALAPLNLANFELCLAGTILPEARGILKRYEGKFRYIGAIPHSELPRVYSQATVLVLPSVEDGFAYVQAEAMACGLPVIATVNTGAKDLFREGVEGFIVPIRDPAAIRERVILLYENHDLRMEMSRAAVKRVQSMGGWNDYGERAVRLYRTALAARAN
jgi:starch synthase